MNLPFAFHQESFVCIHVFEKTKPILRVSRADGDWTFYCGEVHVDDVSQCRLVGIGHIWESDPSLSELADLEPDWDAERRAVGEAWMRTLCMPDIK